MMITTLKEYNLSENLEFWIIVAIKAQLCKMLLTVLTTTINHYKFAKAKEKLDQILGGV